MKRIAALLAFLTLGATEPSEAPPAAACTAGSARSVSIETVTGDLQAWLGKCVTLTGIAAGIDLLADRSAILESGDYYGESYRHSIVIFPDGPRQPQAPRWVAITGTLGSCRAQNEAAAQYQDEHPDQIIMTSGFCHTSLAPYIEPVAVQPLDRPLPLRLTEAEVPQARRQLVPVPNNFPKLRTYEAAANTLFQALARQDYAAWLPLAYPDLAASIEEEGGPDMPEWLAKRLDQSKTEFAGIAAGFAFKGRPSASLVRRTFANAADLAEWRSKGEKPRRIVTCWCKSGSCKGKWPVVPSDTDNNPARPYLCIGSHPYLIKPGHERIQALYAIRPGGFAEPAWPR